MPNKFKENKEQIPVLIVGGGLTGLSAALCLLQQGIRPVLIERHAGTSIHPRARGFDVRTMELFRELQLDDSIREAGKALAPAWGIYAGATLTGILEERALNPQNIKHPIEMPGFEKLAAMSPVSGARCTQDLSEPVLLLAAIERGADIRFNTQLLSFIQNENTVTAYTRNSDTGEDETLTCNYMIAADGGGSAIRKALDAATVGDGPLGTLLNIYFEADLHALVKGREFSISLIERPGITGMIAAINNSNKWVFHLHYDAKNGEKPEDYTTARVEQILRNSIGIPDLPVRVISILPWKPTVNVVRQMQHGRIFLAGDAAHQMTPYGGKGAATGVQDVHNLAWKLALVLQHKAAPSLLHTYSEERQPIGLENALLSGQLADDKGLINYRKMLDAKDKAGGFDNATWMIRMLGIPDYTYTSSAIPGATSVDNSQVIKAGGQPGTRIPHVWLYENGSTRSTLDLAVTHFTLITDDTGSHWQEAALQAATAFNIDIPVQVITDEHWQSLAALPAGSALLVRPDGFVAWRSVAENGHAATELQQALKTILS